MSTSIPDQPEACTLVYYDGACPVCRREIDWYRGKAGPDVVFHDVAAASEAPAPDLPRDAALERFHLRRANGTLVSGAAAFVALWATIPRLAPWARIAGYPPVLAVLEIGYRAFLVIRRLWRR